MAAVSARAAETYARYATSSVDAAPGFTLGARRSYRRVERVAFCGERSETGPLRRFGRRVDREANGKATSLAGTGAGRVDGAPVHLGQAADQRQAQTKTATSSTVGCIELCEWFEDIRQLCQRQTVTRVPDDDVHLACGPGDRDG